MQQKYHRLTASINQFQETRHQQLRIKEQMVQLQERINTQQYYIDQQTYNQKQEYITQQERIQTEYNYVKQQCEALEHQKNDINSQLHTSTKNLEILQQKLTELGIALCNYQAYNVQFEKRKSHYQQWTSLGNILRNHQSITNQKLLWQNNTNPSCPLCEQNLSASRKKFLQAKCIKEAAYVLHRLNRLKNILPKLKEILIVDHNLMNQLQLKQTELATLQQKLTHELQSQKERMTMLNNITNQITIYKTKHISLAQELTHLKKYIESSFILESLKDHFHALNTTKDEYEKLNVLSKNIIYDPEAHEKAIQEQLALDHYLKNNDQHSLHHTLHQKKQAVQMLCRILKELYIKQKEFFTLNTDITIYKKQKNMLESEITNIQTKIDALVKNKEQLLHTTGILDAQQKRFNIIADEYTQEQKKLDAFNTIIADYTAIAYASSKDGIQALLIEETLPEIEQEANILLSKLTHNNAHIMIESLRDLKKGGTKETLDIKISDAAGIRAYELFSGGEAFRIDFALRIAISKLLARRAGTTLQTLIIDEGFGSQDEEGLSLIMDALYAIQDDFAKIIIVSHLPQMKDQFPVHFVVEKIAGSSVVHIIQNG
jgi:exonuclease SbcC